MNSEIEQTILSLLDCIRISLSFKVKGLMDIHRVSKTKKEYRKCLKKLKIDKIDYEIDRFMGQDNTYCITVWFKNKDWACFQSQDLMTVIDRFKAILFLQAEIKGVKK